MTESDYFKINNKKCFLIAFPLNKRLNVISVIPSLHKMLWNNARRKSSDHDIERNMKINKDRLLTPCLTAHTQIEAICIWFGFGEKLHAKLSRLLILTVRKKALSQGIARAGHRMSQQRANEKEKYNKGLCISINKNGNVHTYSLSRTHTLIYVYISWLNSTRSHWHVPLMRERDSLKIHYSAHTWRAIHKKRNPHSLKMCTNINSISFSQCRRKKRRRNKFQMLKQNGTRNKVSTKMNATTEA